MDFIIARLMKGRTAIIIAHRPPTVRALDRILVFDRGEVIKGGDHTALLANPRGMYRRLFGRRSGAIKVAETLISE